MNVFLKYYKKKIMKNKVGQFFTTFEISGVKIKASWENPPIRDSIGYFKGYENIPFILSEKPKPLNKRGEYKFNCRLFTSDLNSYMPQEILDKKLKVIIK